MDQTTTKKAYQQLVELMGEVTRLAESNGGIKCEDGDLSELIQQAREKITGQKLEMNTNGKSSI